MNAKLYERFASLLLAVENCRASGNDEWEKRHTETLDRLAVRFLPSGSGFDAGSSLLFAESTSERLVFATSFHHMNEHGSYDGWSNHKVVVTPSLAHGFNLRVTGRDRNDIKDYIAEVFQHVLSAVTRTEDVYPEEKSA